jgi:predicted methyltransferase
LTLSAIAAAPAAISQTAPDYAAFIAAPDRSDADRKLDTNRAPAQWLAFIGAKPGMKILDIEAVYGWKAELLARAVATSCGSVPPENHLLGYPCCAGGAKARRCPHRTPVHINAVSL